MVEPALVWEKKIGSTVLCTFTLHHLLSSYTAITQHTTTLFQWGAVWRSRDYRRDVITETLLPTQHCLSVIHATSNTLPLLKLHRSRFSEEGGWELRRVAGMVMLTSPMEHSVGGGEGALVHVRWGPWGDTCNERTTEIEDCEHLTSQAYTRGSCQCWCLPQLWGFRELPAVQSAEEQWEQATQNICDAHVSAIQLLLCSTCNCTLLNCCSLCLSSSCAEGVVPCGRPCPCFSGNTVSECSIGTGGTDGGGAAAE